jgi:hypothetical protein
MDRPNGGVDRARLMEDFHVLVQTMSQPPVPEHPMPIAEISYEGVLENPVGQITDYSHKEPVSRRPQKFQKFQASAATPFLQAAPIPVRTYSQEEPPNTLHWPVTPPPENNHPPFAPKLSPLPSSRHPASKDMLLRALDLDYQLSSPAEPTINCTLTELVVFLPLLFQNQWMATRFINHGMRPPIQREMLRAHRAFDESNGENFNLKTIFTKYRTAMRGSGWEAGMRNVEEWESRRQEAMKKSLHFGEHRPVENPEWHWERTKHIAPQGWDNSDISVNHYVPDRIRLPRRFPNPGPRPIPFRALADGVAKFPQGYDAADLTHAIEYAIANERPINNGNPHWMFPHDWQGILAIIGRTQVKEGHLDPSCIRRYEDRWEKFTKTGASEPPIASSENTSTLPTLPLIRRDLQPLLNDCSERAQIIKYAQQNLHTDWVWSEHHVYTIMKLLSSSWIGRLNMLLDESNQPRWLWVNNKATSSVITRFVNFGMQRSIHWRICMGHAQVLAHVDMSSPEMTLPALADVVMNFRAYSQSTSGGLVHAPACQSETLDAMRQLSSTSAEAGCADAVPMLSTGQADLVDMLGPIQDFNVGT